MKFHQFTQKNIISLQNYFKVNKSRINMQKKKEKIKNIQAMYNANQCKKKFFYKNQQIFIIQNSLRIINSKRIVQQKKSILIRLSLHIQMYLSISPTLPTAISARRRQMLSISPERRSTRWLITGCTPVENIQAAASRSRAAE